MVLGSVAVARATPAEVLADVESRIGELVRATADHPDGPFAGACELAEHYLETWLDPDALPPGPPLA
jgi:glutamate dehydrogenase (NAD(P)+)